MRLPYPLLLIFIAFVLMPDALCLNVNGGSSVSTSASHIEGNLITDNSGAMFESSISGSADLHNDFLVEDSVEKQLIALGSTFYVSPGVGAIQSAVNAADSGSKIILEHAKYIDNVEINKPLRIEGPDHCGNSGMDKATVEGAKNGGSVFKIGPGIDVTLLNLNIQGGTGTQGDFGISGGGIYNQGFLTMKDCTISDNTAQFGGGIYNTREGTIFLTRCAIEDNQAVSTGNDAISGGGGIFNYHGNLNIFDCTISGNSAMASASSEVGNALAVGGAINNAGVITISASKITGNTATAATSGINKNAIAAGGGINNAENGVVQLNANTQITDNIAKASIPTDRGTAYAVGGGFSISSGTLSMMDNSRIAENSAYSGGGIYNYRGTLNIDPNHIIGNSPDNIYTVP